MTDIILTFYERIHVWSYIGNFQAPRLKDVAILLRVIEKVRPADIETTETQLVTDGNQISWKLPEPHHGDRTVELESEEAQALVSVLESVENVRVADGAWICALVDRLKAPQAEEKEGKGESTYA